MASISWLNEVPAEAQSNWTRAKATRLKEIYEDEGLDYDEDTFDVNGLTDKFKVATTLREKRITEVFQDIRRAQHVQLCFLVDCTGSMSGHIDGVRRSIDAILEQLIDNGPRGILKNSNRAAQSMAVAFVAYRNINDSNRIEKLPFTNVEEFKRFSHGLQANGGEGVEDVFGGLETALDLPWSMDCGTKVIFHIGDTPCHGREFHKGEWNDNYPDGDPQGRTPTKIFTKMRAQGIQYHFGKITETTNIMIKKFSESYGEPITVFDVKNVEDIKESVSAAVVMSIAAVANANNRVGGGARRVRAFTLDKAEPASSALRELRGTFVSYEFPRSIQDIEKDVPLVSKSGQSAHVKVATNPFARGAERIAFYGKDMSRSSEDIVLKEYLHTGKRMNSAERYDQSNQMQTIASFLAQKFVKDLTDRGVDQALTFIEIRTLCVKDGSDCRYMSVEKLLSADKKFVRFTNNGVYQMPAAKAAELGVDIDYVHLVTAFTHWTYKASNRFLMVVDLEGVVGRLESGKTGVLLTDPAIHCKDVTRYVPMNYGVRGMKMFFDGHECNKFCKKLGLENYL